MIDLNEIAFCDQAVNMGHSTWVGAVVQRNLSPSVWGRPSKQMISELEPKRGGASHRKLLPGRGDSRYQGPEAGEEGKGGLLAKEESRGM